MQTQKTRLWLTVILLLTAAAFVIVFEPVSWGPRKNLATQKYEESPVKIARLQFFPPSANLRLGLDLQGGTHLVLQAAKTGVYEFKLPELTSSTSEDDRSKLRVQALEALSPDSIRKRKRDIEEIASDRLVVRCAVTGEAGDLAEQGKLVLDALKAKFPGIELAGSTLEQIKREDLPTIQEIVGRRVDAFGVTEPVIQVEEPDKLLVELPGVDDPQRAKDLIQKTAVLEFRAIPPRYARGDRAPRYDRTNNIVIGFTDSVTNEDVSVARVLDESKIVTTGKFLKRNSEVQTVPGQGTVVTFAFLGKGSDAISDYTRKHVDDYLCIVLDGKPISCPRVQSHLPGSGIIESGSFNTPEGMKEAKELSILLNAGALPVDLNVVEERVVSATLGKDELNKSLLAGLVGMALVLIFMVAYYRLPGLLADAALVVYCLFLLAVFRVMNATLTLPGVFGIVLSIGMAVDANVIIFERIKEELRSGKTLKAAIDAGFHRAWTAILDSNVCSLITGFVLFGLGTGAIKGFAVALISGVAVSMFTAVFVTRLFMKEIAATGAAENLALFGISQKELAEG